MVKSTKKGYKVCSKCIEEFPLYMFTKQGKYYGSYCYECKKLDSEERRRKAGQVKGGQGKGAKTNTKVSPAQTAEERRIRQMEYGYIHKGASIEVCTKCKRRFEREVVTDGVCAVCSRKRIKPKKIGRPKKYKNQIERSLANKAHSKSAKHKRRALERTEHFSGKEWLDLKAKYNNTCLRCKCTDCALEADHIKPLSKGGSNHINNIQPLCAKCNNWKATQEIDYRNT